MIYLCNMLRKLVCKIYHETESEKTDTGKSPGKVDQKTITILLLVPICLSMIQYFGDYKFLRDILQQMGANTLLAKSDRWFGGNNSLGDLTYWGLNLFIFYALVPMIVIKFIFNEKLTDYGLRLKGAYKGYQLYVILLLVMIPLVLYFSRTESFQSRYPFLKIHTKEDVQNKLWKWEIIYACQFFALEFFFRGFVLFGLKPRFGIYAVFIMTIPYCMIHFGKPFPETIAAVVAGVVLGFLSLKNKSVWLGFLIHVSVGLSMDLASLWQKGWI